MSLTVIEQVSWVIAWDEASGGHVYLNDVDVAFSTEAGFTYVGPRFEDAAETRIPGRGRMVMPGLVNIHTHPTSEP